MMEFEKKDKLANYIDGKWIDGSGKSLSSYNPYTTEKIFQGNMAGSDNIEHAYSSSKNAFKKWSTVSYDDRLKIIKQFQSIINKNKVELANLISRENGKPQWESTQEVQGIIGKVDLSIDAIKQRQGNMQKEFNGI